MSTFYEMEFTVNSRDVDLTGCARPSAVLGYLQEAATQAAAQLHISGPEAIEKYNAFWMIVRMWVRLDEPLRWNETITVRTWHRGGMGASSYRDFDLFKDGQKIGEAVSVWVLADCDTFHLLRMDRLVEFQGTDGGELCKKMKLHRVKLPEKLPGRCERTMRYSDTDLNGHVNNTRYADFACDALHLEEKLRGSFVHELQINYTNQCRAGETIWLETAEEAGQCWVRGVDGDGRERFDCRLSCQQND